METAMSKIEDPRHEAKGFVAAAPDASAGQEAGRKKPGRFKSHC